MAPTVITNSILSLEEFGSDSIELVSSVRWLILNDLISTVENITAANGYTNTINYVSLDPIDYDEIDDAQIPFAIVDDLQNSDEIITPSTNIHVDCDFEIDLLIVFKASNNLSENVDSLIKDMKKALEIDTTRNDNALFTEILNISIEKAEKKNVVVLSFRILIQYMHLYSTP